MIKNDIIKYLLIASFFVLFEPMGNAQLYVEGSFTATRAFNFQKNDHYLHFNADTGSPENYVKSYLGEDYLSKYFSVGIGYRLSQRKLKHSVQLSYNRKGAGGNFKLNINEHPIAVARRGSFHFLVHASGSTYTDDSTGYRIEYEHNNIGLTYKISSPIGYGFNLNPFIQFDYSVESNYKFTSINNGPPAGPITIFASFEDKLSRSEYFDDQLRKYLFSLGMEVEYELNPYISFWLSGSQAITSYNRRSYWVYKNTTYVTSFQAGVRLYR